MSNELIEKAKKKLEKTLSGKLTFNEGAEFVTLTKELIAAYEDSLATIERMKTDAERWQALLRCARIRMQGSAGIDPVTGERREYSNETGEYTYGDTSGWVHFGAEFWSIYPSYVESKTQEERDAENLWGRNALIALADDVILKERQMAKPEDALLKERQTKERAA